MVVEAQQEELQSGHGGQAVVDIIERALVDVQLTLPAGAAAVEGQVVEVDPRAVLVFQLEPHGVPLVGSGRGSGTSCAGTHPLRSRRPGRGSCPRREQGILSVSLPNSR